MLSSIPLEMTEPLKRISIRKEDNFNIGDS